MRLTEENRTTLNNFLAQEDFPVIAENVEEAQLRALLTTAKSKQNLDQQKLVLQLLAEI